MESTEPMDFVEAERAAEEAVEALLTEGGEVLYQAYLNRKSIPFASEAMADLTRLELQMCFVRHDSGESPDDRDLWSMDAEPAPNLIDTWARACVPVRRKFVRAKNSGDDKNAGRRGRGAKGTITSGNSPQAKQGGTMRELGTDIEAKVGGTRSQMIPLNEEREEDEEETLLREQKEREAKRKREEEARLARKIQEEADEAARLAQVKDQMKNKPYTYDSDGNIIWIQPVPTEKLPNANPNLNYTFKKVAQKDAHEDDKKTKATGKERVKKKRVKRELEFADSFKKLTSQQPPMMEAMTMAPGVQLSERGRSKKGHNVDAKEKGRMTRKDYMAMVQNASGAFSVPGADQSMAAPMGDAGAATRDADMVASSFEQGATQQATMSEKDAFNLAIVNSSDWGNAGSKAQDGAKPVQPVPPSTVHNPKYKRDAVGYRPSARDRAPTSGTSMHMSMQQHRPQPPMHATMGHGLLPADPPNKHGEFYFPNSPRGMGGITNLSESEEEATSPKAQKATGGEIHAENRQLIQRLFR